MVIFYSYVNVYQRLVFLGLGGNMATAVPLTATKLSGESAVEWWHQGALSRTALHLEVLDGFENGPTYPTLRM